ncbi:MAG: ATP-binding cassette domain-containing protein [Ruminococcus sp.]|nr:ATP-binding cassette domain-containing protein [Ruminococcus sp.]
MEIVKFESVTRVYKSGDHELKALDNVSFTLDEGKFVVILGPSGAGKSTLLNMLGGLDSPSEGTITVGGRDISTLSDNELADKLKIDYSVSAIYTDKKTNEIKSSDLISGKQDKAQLMETFNSFVQIMDSMVVILVIAAAVLGIVVLYNLGVMSYVERSRELATLKVLGFRNRTIGRLLISQNIWLTFIGVIVGLPAGVLVLRWLITALAGEYEMKLMLGALTYSVSVLLTFGVSLMVGLMVAKKNKKIDMVEALKG